MKPKCVYCGDERENLDGWHSCHQAQDRKVHTEQTVERLIRVADHEEGYVSPEEVQRNYIENVEPYDYDR